MELQRADWRGKAEGQIVPGPAGAERLVGQHVVVADQPPVDVCHAEHGQPAGPLVEHTRRVRALADGRIAIAGDDEVAAQHAVLDRAGRLEAGGEARVPAEPLGGDREGDHLHRRRRHHQQPRVALEDHLAGVERYDLGRPQGVDVGRVEDGAEPIAEVIGRGTASAGAVRLAATARATPIRGNGIGT